MATRHQRRRAAKAKANEWLFGVAPAARAYLTAETVKSNLSSRRGELSPHGMGNRSIYQGDFAARANGGMRRLREDNSDAMRKRKSHATVDRGKHEVFSSPLPATNTSKPYVVLEPRGSLVTDDMINRFIQTGGMIKRV